MDDEIEAIEIGTTETTSNTKRVVFLGLLTLLTISAASLLHVNQPEFILDRFVGISEFEYSLFDSTLYLSYLIIGITTGLLSDRWGKRREFVLVGATGSMLFYWLMTTTLSFPMLLLYRFLQGSFTVMVWQTFMTLAIDFSDRDNRGKTMGIFGAFLALSFAVGPAVGGIIASVDVYLPYYVAVVFNAIVLVISLIGLRDPDESLRGMALAIFAMPYIILQYPMGKLSDKYGRLPQLVVGSIGFGVVLAMIGIIGIVGFDILLIMLVILGIFAGITSPPSMALVGDIVEKDDSAMGMGFFNFLGNLGITIGPIVFGVLTPIIGLNNAFVVVGLLELLTLVVNVILVKTVFKNRIT